MAKNNSRRRQRILKNGKGSMSDRNDNTESICNRKTTKTTTNINSSASKKSETYSKQEMQQTDCDIQRDQQCRATTTKHSNNDNKAKNDDPISPDTLTSDNNNNKPKAKMRENDEENEQSIDDERELSDSRIENNKQEHNNNNTITVNVNNETKLKDESSVGEHVSRNGSAKKKVQGERENESARMTDKFKCPVCDLKLDSQHTFTIHIRQHNPSDHSHTCRLCGKTLSSASSLDRHMLIHSGERPFKCRICNMAFTTNGNMHRHMRTHGMEVNDECNGADGNNNNTNNNKLIKSKKRKVSEDGVNDEDSKLSPKRRNSEGDELLESKPNFSKDIEIYCPVCKKSFVSKSALHSHMENHPNDPIYCRDCGMILNNYATYTQHRCTATASIEGTTNLFNPNRMNFSTAPPVGFYDLSFTDFTSRKFSMIAKSFCEDNLRKASSPYHDFECDKCHRAFPCGSALNLHQSTHNGETYCGFCHSDFATPSLYLSHQMKHRFDYPLSFSSTIPQPHGFIPPTAGSMNGSHHNSYGDVPQSDKEDFLALLDLQNKGSQFSSIQSNYKFIRNEDPFENPSYYIHAKPVPPRPTTFQPKIITNGTDSESGKHDLADIQSIISVTSSATPLISSIRSSPPAASPASPVHLGVSGAQPGSPVAADSANASPNTPSLNSLLKTENDEKQDIVESTEGNNEKSLSIVIEGEEELTPNYKCNKCSLMFKSSNALKRHNRGHTQGGHSYACHLCSYTSLDKSTLVRHLRTHNGERPFQCAICKYAFTTKANCERHVKKRHKKLQKQEIRSAMQYNPNMSTTSTLTNQNLTKSDTNLSLSPSSDGFPGGFDTVCKYCNVDFKFNRVLRHHLRSLHNSCSRKPYCCTVCKLGFSTKNNCIRHVVKQHPDMKDKLSTVVLANATSVSLNSDHSESESVFRDSPEISSNQTNEFITASSDNSQNISLTDSSMNVSITSAPPQHSSLAALCQIAKNISVNNDKPINLALEGKDNPDDEDTDVGGYEDQPLNLASHSQEEQPLDLAVHALDLSCKSSYPIKEMFTEDIKVNEAVRTAASSLLALRSMAANTVFPSAGLLGTTSLYHPGISLTPPLPAHSSPSVSMLSPNSCTSMEDIYKVATFRISKNRLMPRNERSFTCIYCSAGFTLKSNMERHIKRKHPEFARPPRTRGGSAAVQQSSQNSSSSASLLSKSSNATLSSKTRAALRVVLSNKVLGSSTGVSNNSRPSSPTESLPNDFTTKITEDNNSNCVDNNGGDLASVSSLIDHSANSSNALKQYFDKQNEDIDSNAGEVTRVELKASTNSETIRPNNSTKSEKSSARRRGRDANKMNTGVVTKKRSAYTDSPNSVSCPYCARKFPWTSSLRRHILTHTGLKPYKCPKCPILFTTKSNCERHLLRKHNGREKRNVVEQPVISQDNKPFKCNVCPNSTFTTQGNLRKHYYLRHWTKTGKGNNVFKTKKGDKTEDEINETNETIETNTSIPVEDEEMNDRLNFRCYLCDMSFNGRLKCLSHLQSCHSNEYEILQSKGAVDKVPTTETKFILDNHNEDYEPYGQEKIFCVFCPRQFMSLENLRRHMRVHLGERPFKCTLCTKKFSLKNSLLRHHRTNHPESVLSARGKGKSKQIISPSTQTTSTIKETESQPSNKAVKPKGSCNSLLYLIPKDSMKQSETYAQNTNTSYGDIGDGSDLIQNLLGIQDSKMIDEMLDSADSAARILGVKDAL